MLCGKRQMDGTMVHCFSLALDMRDPDSSGSLLLRNCDYNAAEMLEDSLYHLTLPDDWRGRRRMLYSSWNEFTLKSCSEPRDYIYALLSIVQPISITVDYSKPLVDVFTDATRSIIAQEQHLNILCINVNTLNLPKERGSQGQVFHELPSWVPNYAGHHRIWNLINTFLPLDKQFYRGGGLMTAPNLTAEALNHRSLEIYGSFCGKIVSVSDRIPSWIEDEKVLGTVEQFRMFSPLVSETKDPSNNSGEEEYWRVMVGDVYNESPNTGKKRIEWNAKARSNLLHDINLAKVSKMPTRMVGRVRRVLRGANFCTTTNNSVAVVQGNAKAGDDIFIARGATLPFIIRAVESDKITDAVRRAHDNSRLYIFVGGSYVHGSMDGQILEEREAKGIPDETVVLV